jgi:hypothetical protein
MRHRAMAILVMFLSTASTVLAQSASIEGRIVDEQALAVPGVAVTVTSRLDLIGEIFNLLDASNPAAFNRQRLLGVNSPNRDFMQPAAFAGDFQQPEQRVGQIGVRWRFGK